MSDRLSSEDRHKNKEDVLGGRGCLDVKMEDVEGVVGFVEIIRFSERYAFL